MSLSRILILRWVVQVTTTPTLHLLISGWHASKRSTTRAKQEKALVDMPDLSDPTMYGRIEWDYDEAETPYLTQKGFKQVRADLRADFKLKVDVLAPIISTVTGLLGVVVAILAIVYAK